MPLAPRTPRASRAVLSASRHVVALGERDLHGVRQPLVLQPAELQRQQLPP